jgi:hypothetical protein
MAIESSKLTERIAVNFTESEALDLMHLAAGEDRTVAEYIRRCMRGHMYGLSKRPRKEGNESISDFQALS